MKLAIIFAATILAVNALSEKDHWENFKVTHNKNYRNHIEENYRFEIFRNNLKAIEEHNKKYEAGELLYFKAINQFADLTKAEFSALLGYKSKNRTSEVEFYKYNGLDLPNSIDWREKGAVLAVRHQISCGSCWAHSAVGALEGQNFIVNGKSDLLSPQELVDCSDDFRKSDCVNGGDMLEAFEYVKYEGLDTEEQYPYDDEKLSCRSKSPKAIRISGYKLLARDENIIKEAVATVGPVSIALNSSPLDFYAGGIIDGDCDPKAIDHGVLIVGYGSENGEDYWIVKNSWGSSFGENGFFRIKRGVNQCGLTYEVSYPIL
ncbi:cathepsin L-like proteinase [Diabrotica undecimpunctata]|uniref:cathepsin L-like proteinase n=1 Tax=Diabrotica undecimpunctata TaxID=50387 RepID=UPI003B641263